VAIPLYDINHCHTCDSVTFLKNISISHTRKVASLQISVGIADMPTLINAVHQALASVGAPAVEAFREPAVSIRASVKPDVVTCMDCGFAGKMLKRHLMVSHGLTPVDYKARWKLSADHPLIAPNYAAKRGEIAKATRLGRKPEAPVAAKVVRKRLKVAIPAPEAD
jgi:predicted transcriptional regulator